jgi:Fe2+ or Zn2+ uptake regulation protein
LFLKNKKEGVTVTKQKKLVLTIIERSHGHLSAEEIFFRAREEMPNIALGTVYRNLNSLTEEGIVRRITLPGTSDRFDTMIRPHDHLICQKCGRIKDVHLTGVEEAIRSVTGDDISFYELNAYYICDECREKETGEAAGE